MVHHGHSHLHSCSSGEHSHGRQRNGGLSDDELLPVPAASANGYEPLTSDGRDDVQLLVRADDDDGDADWPPQSGVQREHRSTNVNIRAAMVHVIGDLIQSVGVFTAAIVVLVKVCCSQSVRNSCPEIPEILNCPEMS